MQLQFALLYQFGRIAEIQAHEGGGAMVGHTVFYYKVIEKIGQGDMGLAI